MIRNRIKSSSKMEQYITIPVRKTRSRSELLVCDALVEDDVRWRSKHLGAVEVAYGRAPYADSILDLYRARLNMDSARLADITGGLITDFCRYLGIDTPIIWASDLGALEGTKDSLLVEVCKVSMADEYLSAPGSAGYIEAETEGGAFASAGIALGYHSYEHPEYRQMYGGFLPYMGIIDLLMNESPENALAIIRSGRRPALSSAEVRTQVIA